MVKSSALSNRIVLVLAFLICSIQVGLKDESVVNVAESTSK